MRETIKWNLCFCKSVLYHQHYLLLSSEPKILRHKKRHKLAHSARKCKENKLPQIPATNKKNISSLSTSE
jgi:hypothetical protein